MENKHWMKRDDDPDLTGDEMIEFLDEYCKCVYICDRD